MLTVILLIVIFICVAMMWTEGFWGNALTFVNVVFAALIATNYFEPVAQMLESQMKSYTYVCDFLALWILFVLSLLILRTATDQASRQQVRFKLPVEIGGRAIFALLTGWVFMSFMLMTLHTAPLARTAFRGSFEPTIMGTSFLGLAPDRSWLAFVHSRSKPNAALSRTNAVVFDEKGDFIPKYAERRESLHENNKRVGTIRIK